MRLAWIEVRDFRNHRETSLEVPEGLTAMVGPNGHGKTNLLEAMHYLFALESPRVRTDLPLVRVGARSAFLRGEIHARSGTFLVEIEIRPSGAHRVQVNRTVVRRRREPRRGRGSGGRASGGGARGPAGSSAGSRALGRRRSGWRMGFGCPVPRWRARRSWPGSGMGWGSGARTS